jgi:glycogen synthase
MNSPTRVLMFGWEFPPHISGGLGTACFGLTQSLSRQGVQLLFVMPRASGDEDQSVAEIINASEVILPLNPVKPYKTVSKGSTLKSGIITIPVPVSITPYTSPLSGAGDESGLTCWSYSFSEEPVALTSLQGKKYTFSGHYGPNLMEEVKRYAEVAGEIARQYEFDIIHAHDWLTYRCGIEAKRVSGKPLVVHMHATEFDRSGERINREVFTIEQEGMKAADRVIAVSRWTKKIVVERYGISPRKIVVVHNGVVSKKPFTKKMFQPPFNKPVVTFLGRITQQKGPQYFVDAARLVLKKIKDAHFVIAGSGDMLPETIEQVAGLKISSRFHFTGFLRGEEVDRIWKMTDVYVMPSVSEPFGISPLEAAQAGVPVIISRQSGVSEVMKHAVKVDFWNTKALANAIIRIVRNKPFSDSLKTNGREEVKHITWHQSAKKVKAVYDKVLHTSTKKNKAIYA